MSDLPSIGFVILSHRQPDQLERLIRTLNALYDHPPITCHHDFSQAALEPARFPANVRFVEDWLVTGWGKFSVVQGFLNALALLYEDGGPDWFTLVSGADYPAAPAETVLAELRDCGCDALLDAHQISPAPAAATMRGAFNPRLWHLETDNSRRQKWVFYLARQFSIPRPRRDPRWRLGRHIVRLPWEDRSFFSPDFTLWWGDHWFSGNRRVAGVLLHPTDRHRRLQRFLRWKPSADECYYQTVLCNTPGLTIDRDNRRFCEWNGGGAHPATLRAADVPQIMASGAHFARKFDGDAGVLDMIDAALGLAQPPAVASVR